MSTCIRCHAGFQCGMVEHTGEPCWCAALPPLPADALPQAGQPGCLCPDCLRAWLAERAAAQGS